MNTQEQKRLRELASGLLVDLGRVPDTDENAALIETAILAAIEPYRAALVKLLAMRDRKCKRQCACPYCGFTDAIARLVGEPNADGYHNPELPR